MNYYLEKTTITKTAKKSQKITKKITKIKKSLTKFEKSKSLVHNFRSTLPLEYYNGNLTEGYGKICSYGEVE